MIEKGVNGGLDSNCVREGFKKKKEKKGMD